LLNGLLVDEHTYQESAFAEEAFSQPPTGLKAAVGVAENKKAHP
jgi:hypothetical protein